MGCTSCQLLVGSEGEREEGFVCGPAGGTFVSLGLTFYSTKRTRSIAVGPSSDQMQPHFAWVFTIFAPTHVCMCVHVCMHRLLGPRTGKYAGTWRQLAVAQVVGGRHYWRLCMESGTSSPPLQASP